MMGYVEFIESGETGPVTGEQTDALRIVAQQGRRLQFIFNSLLTLQTFRQQEISPERMDIVAWLHEIVGAWRRLASDAGIAIQLEMPHHPLPVMGAPNYLELVIGNLLDNAIKFSPNESTITLSAWSDDDNVLIAVADQGIGIPQEQLDRIFTRFYQIDSTPARRVGGMGIGLALGRAIIAAHGGRIWAESAGSGQGSTFHIALPVAPQQEQAPGNIALRGNV
jgi:signal transduction histidine kinase